MEEGEGKGTIKEPNPLSQVPISALIEELGRRKLTKEETNALQSLRAEEPTDKSKTQNRELLPDGRATNAPQKTTVSPEVVDKESPVEKFVKAIVKKNVHSKFPKGTMINGVAAKVLPGQDEMGPRYGFEDTGPDQIKGPPGKETAHPVSEVQKEILIRSESAARDVPWLVSAMRSSFVGVAPSADPANMILDIGYFQNTKPLDYRRDYNAMHAQIEFSKEVLAEFLKEIKKNPDLLEEFYQKAFVGLDSKDNSPGAKRVRADGFYLLIGEDLAKVNKSVYNRTFVEVFNGLQKYKYGKGPYGSVDFVVPRPH